MYSFIVLCLLMLLSALGTFYGFVVSVINGSVLIICLSMVVAEREKE